MHVIYFYIEGILAQNVSENDLDLDLLNDIDHNQRSLIFLIFDLFGKKDLDQ